jgi:hypothetical protein
MTTRLFHCTSLLIAMLALVVTIAPAQTPTTQTPSTQTLNLQTTANTDARGRSEAAETQEAANGGQADAQTKSQ